jgi:hypothetical protein
MLASHGAAELKDLAVAVQLLEVLLSHDPGLLELKTSAGNTYVTPPPSLHFFFVVSVSKVGRVGCMADGRTH